MSPQFSSLMDSLAAIERRLEDQNTIIHGQREELAATRLKLGHAQERVESLEYELAYVNKTLLPDEQRIMEIWLRALGGKVYPNAHFVNSPAETTRKLRGVE